MTKVAIIFIVIVVAAFLLGRRVGIMETVDEFKEDFDVISNITNKMNDKIIEKDRIIEQLKNEITQLKEGVTTNEL